MKNQQHRLGCQDRVYQELIDASERIRFEAIYIAVHTPDSLF
jgi:hypothetical protein